MKAYTDIEQSKKLERNMKKITILLMSITCLLLASCESKEEEARNVSHVDVLHEGHRYVVFYSNGGYGEAMCVLHSPDCVCNKND